MMLASKALPVKKCCTQNLHKSGLQFMSLPNSKSQIETAGDAICRLLLQISTINDHSGISFRAEDHAGLLHHLPALYMFIAPSPTSYWRLQPDTWSGAYRYSIVQGGLSA